MKKLFLTMSVMTVLVFTQMICRPGWSRAAEYHGADSVFRLKDVAVLWAILKGSDDAHSTVVIRIENLRPGEPEYRAFSVSAVHPFSDAQEWVVRNEPFHEINLIKSSRSSFRDMPGRRILLYKKPEGQQAPDDVIYYMSLPDTAPEFLDAGSLEAYLNDAVKRVKK